MFSNPAKGAPITWENLSRPPLLRHIGVTRPVWPGSVQGAFFPSLAASAMLSKKPG